MNKLVTVIMSTYNEPIPMIMEAIDSVISQTYPCIELIIVNDNPDREDLDLHITKIAAIHDNVFYIKNSENLGLVQSLNLAIKRANGAYIARMDADDVSQKQRIELQVNYLETHECDFVGCAVEKIDEKGEQLGEILVPTTHEKIVALTRYGSCLPHPTWLLKTEIYKNLNGYRNIYACEDYDFIIRAIDYGYTLGNLKTKLLNYRIRKTGISSTMEIVQRLTMYYISASYYGGNLPSVNEIDNYLSSDRFKRDYAKLKQYVEAKNSAMESKSYFRKGLLMLPCVFNKYLYKSIYRKVKQMQRY